MLKLVCKDDKVPINEFIVHADSRCGSTIGPMVCSLLGCIGVDIGGP